MREVLLPSSWIVQSRLAEVASDPRAAARSRVSVLLANDTQEQTLTITHVLWAMFGILPEGQVQPPHRHQSVALDLILDCQPGCYTLLGESLDDEGKLVNPVRVDWEPGAAFVIGAMKLFAPMPVAHSRPPCIGTIVNIEHRDGEARERY